MKNFSTFVCAALLTFSTPANAQDAQDSAEDEAASVETDAERVVRIEKVIESDKARLAELKNDLEEREKAFERTGQDLTKREARLETLETQLEGTVD